MGGTIKGNYIANSYSPYLEIRWDDLERDVANNRTKVRARLYFKKDTNSRINYNVRYKGTLTINGNTKSFNAGGQYLNGSRAFSVQIAEHTVWVPHNSDGTKTVRFDGTYTAGITWSGVYHGTMRVGGSDTLPRIPRQSTITSFSFPSSLNGGESSVNFKLNVPLSGAKHTIRVKMGNTLIKELTNQGNISSMDLSATQVGNMLKRVLTASRGQATLEVITYTGGNQIGSTQSRNANFTIDINHANLRPSITNFTNYSHRSATTAAEARLAEYYKNISHVRASFSAGTKYGATRVTSGINIRSSNGNDTNFITGLDGVTTSKVSQSGDYTLEAFVTDSRGAKETQSVTINVIDYTPITVTSFTGTRRASNPSIIDVKATINASHFPIPYDLWYRKSSGSGATGDFTLAVGTTSSSSTITYDLTNTDRAASYEFRLSASDRFNRVETKVSVTTERALISFNKDKGIGVGKIHERGVMDVRGDAYFSEGKIYSNGSPVGETSGTRTTNLNSSGSNTDVNFRHVSATAENNPSSAEGFLFEMYGGTGNAAQFYLERDGAQRLYTRAKSNGGWHGWKMIADVDTGSNDNGEWVGFGDGTQICTTQQTLPQPTSRNTTGDWTFPKDFITIPVVVASKTSYTSAYRYTNGTIGGNGISTAKAAISFSQDTKDELATDFTPPYSAIAIGRWK